MQRRFRLRAAIMAWGGRTGDHWKLADWRQDLVDAESGQTASLKAGRKEGLAGESGIDTGPLLHWDPGTPLPDAGLREPSLPWPRRLAQRFAYAALLPWLDRRRPSFDPAYRPLLIPEAENAHLTP